MNNRPFQRCTRCVMDTTDSKITFDENGDIVVELHIVVAYGVSIKAVTDNLMQSVKYKVEEFTGMKVGKINIFVEGVRVID